MSNNSKRNIPLKNYLIVLIIVTGIIFLSLYLFRTKNEFIKSDLYRIVYEVKYEELNSSVFLEASDDYFIYISYLDDSNVAKLEEGVKKVIVDNNLQTNFYYLNATDLKEDLDFLNKLNNKLSLNKNKIKFLPAIVFYSNNKLEKVISSKENKVFNISELKKIIKEYELED